MRLCSQKIQGIHPVYVIVADVVVVVAVVIIHIKNFSINSKSSTTSVLLPTYTRLAPPHGCPQHKKKRDQHPRDFSPVGVSFMLKDHPPTSENAQECSFPPKTKKNAPRGAFSKKITVILHSYLAVFQAAVCKSIKNKNTAAQWRSSTRREKRATNRGSPFRLHCFPKDGAP